MSFTLWRKNFQGTLVLSAPYSLTPTTFSLQTVNTVEGTYHLDQVRTLEHECIYNHNETHVEPNYEIKELDSDILILKNSSNT